MLFLSRIVAGVGLSCLLLIGAPIFGFWVFSCPPQGDAYGPDCGLGIPYEGRIAIFTAAIIAFIVCVIGCCCGGALTQRCRTGGPHSYIVIPSPPGDQVTVPIFSQASCHRCNGAGTVTCNECTGTKWTTRWDHSSQHVVTQPCSNCCNSGTIPCECFYYVK